MSNNRCKRGFESGWRQIDFYLKFKLTQDKFVLRIVVKTNTNLLNKNFLRL